MWPNLSGELERREEKRVLASESVQVHHGGHQVTAGADLGDGRRCGAHLRSPED